MDSELARAFPADMASRIFVGPVLCCFPPHEIHANKTLVYDQCLLSRISPRRKLRPSHSFPTGSIHNSKHTQPTFESLCKRSRPWKAVVIS